MLKGRMSLWVGQAFVFAAFFGLWEAAVRMLHTRPVILPAPSVIIAKIVVSWQLLLSNAIVTLQEILLGFGLSVLVAIPLAVAVVYSGILSASRFRSWCRCRPSRKWRWRRFW